MSIEWTQPRLPETFRTVEEFKEYAKTNCHLHNTPEDVIEDLYKTRKETFPEALFNIRNQHLQMVKDPAHVDEMKVILDSVMTSVIGILQPLEKSESLDEKFKVVNSIRYPYLIEEENRVVQDRNEVEIGFTTHDYWKLVNS